MQREEAPENDQSICMPRMLMLQDSAMEGCITLWDSTLRILLIQRQQAAAQKGKYLLKRRRKTIGKEQWTDAYFTVEASLLIPTVLVIFVLLIYLSFYLYDRCLIVQDAYILCFRSSILKEEQDKPQAVLAGKERQYGTKYFAVKNSTGNAAMNGKWVEMQGELEISPIVFQRHFLMSSGRWRVAYRAKAKETDPVKGFRQFGRIQAILKNAAETAAQKGKDGN